MCFSPQRRAIFRQQNFKKCSEDYSFSTFSLPNAPIRTSKSAPKTTVFQHFHLQMCLSELQKVLRRLQFFNIFTGKCAFRHSGVQLFDIGTSKSAPKTTVFEHFHFRMCFSPQPRAFFPHLHFKKWSRIVSFLTFSLPNVLFATAAYNFSTSALQKVVPDRQFFNIFTSEYAFRHSGVQFFDIWTSKSGPGLSVFSHFHFPMWFSPQRRTIFRHQNFKKCFEHVMFCTFSLPNVLFATAACNF